MVGALNMMNEPVFQEVQKLHAHLSRTLCQRIPELGNLVRKLAMKFLMLL